MPRDVDDFDLAILAVVQDADLPIAEVASKVNLSQNACWRRIKRLEAEGYIRKRVALLDAAKLGLGVTVFVTVRAAEHSEAWLENFAAVVRGMPEVVEFYRLSGDVDYLLKVVVSDIHTYDKVYKRLIQSTRLSDVSSAFAMEEIKFTTALPVSRKASLTAAN